MPSIMFISNVTKHQDKSPKRNTQKNRSNHPEHTNFECITSHIMKWVGFGSKMKTSKQKMEQTITPAQPHDLVHSTKLVKKHLPYVYIQKINK